MPGTEVEVTNSQPEAGQVVVRISGTERAIGERAAGGALRAARRVGRVG